MQPFKLNLATETTFWEEIISSLMVLLVLTALAFTGFNAMAWMRNRSTIQLYEERLEHEKRRTEKSSKVKKKARLDTKTIGAIQTDLDYIKRIMAADMFPISRFLEVLERTRPENVDIDAITFSQDLKALTLKGISESAVAVSRFLLELDRSDVFNVQIKSGEINEDKKIVFEIFATLEKK